MEEEKVVDPVKLDLCDYQAIEPTHPFCLLREDLDSLTEVSPYEALVIKDSSKIGAKESLPALGSQQDIMNPEEIPPMNQETPCRTDILDNGLGREANLQHMDQWLIFTKKLRRLYSLSLLLRKWSWKTCFWPPMTVLDCAKVFMFMYASYKEILKLVQFQIFPVKWILSEHCRVMYFIL